MRLGLQRYSAPRKGHIRSSLQTFVAVLLIACTLILHGCGGSSTAPEAEEPPPSSAPTPDPDPAPDPPAAPDPPPAPVPPPSNPTPPPAPVPPSSNPTPPPVPACTSTDTLEIEADDSDSTVERAVECINANASLKGNLEGHMLSVGRAEGQAAEIREDLGLPATGTDFSDASGLAKVLSNVRIHFNRGGSRGDGSGWGLHEGINTFSNWVDGVLFFTALGGFDARDENPHDGLSPVVIGVPSGSNPVPAGMENTAVWTGSVAGRDIAENKTGHLEGNITLTYDFDAATLEIEFDHLRYYLNGHSPEDVDNTGWGDDNISVSNGLFGDCSGSGDCIRGRFFDDNDDTSAESVGGVFRKGTLYGAFGAERQ